MEASLKSLLELFKSAERFVIPEFQRPYSWTLEEVEQLWSDLYEAWQEAGSLGPSGPKADDYFLGPIVVARQRRGLSTEASVIDGQQRLTTIQALLWAVRSKLEQGDGEVGVARAFVDSIILTPTGKTLLAVAAGDQANFFALREDSPLDAVRALGRTGAYLRKKLAEFPTATDLARFVGFVLSEVRIILVQTDSYSSAWELFIGLNGKGKPLNAADLIKALVCGSSVDGVQMADIWEQKVLPLAGDATSALLDTTRVATGNTGSEAKLYKLFESAWGVGKIPASLLSGGAAAYQAVWRTNMDELGDMDALTRRHVRGLRKLDRRDHSSLCLSLAVVYGPTTPLHPALVRALEAYQLWMAVRGRYGRERDFTALAHYIYKSPPASWTKDVRSLLERLAPTRDEVRAAILLASYPGRHMKFLVTQYEEGLRGDVQVEGIEFEHMMPQTTTPYWTDAAGTSNANEYVRIVNNIGNIVPLDAGTNVAGSNLDWPTKSKLYREQVPNWLARQVADENPDKPHAVPPEKGWTPAKIQMRAGKIAEWALTGRWNLGAALEAL